MATTATTIGESAGIEEDSVPAWMLNLRVEVDRKYRARCERRKLNPLDLHDRGENSLTMRQVIANQARAAMRRANKDEIPAVAACTGASVSEGTPTRPTAEGRAAESAAKPVAEHRSSRRRLAHPGASGQTSRKSDVEGELDTPAAPRNRAIAKTG